MIRSERRCHRSGLHGDGKKTTTVDEGDAGRNRSASRTGSGPACDGTFEYLRRAVLTGSGRWRRVRRRQVVHFSLDRLPTPGEISPPKALVSQQHQGFDAEALEASQFGERVSRSTPEIARKQCRQSTPEQDRNAHGGRTVGGQRPATPVVTTRDWFRIGHLQRTDLVFPDHLRLT